MAGDDPNANPEAENTGTNLEMIIGRIIEAAKLDVAPDADIAVVLQAIYEYVSGKGGEEGEGGAEETKAAADLREVFELEATATMAEVLTAAKNAAAKGTISEGSLKTMSERVGVLETTQKATDAEEAFATFPRKINTNDEKQVKACRDWAERDPKGFRAFMETQPDVLPESGAIPGPGEGIAGVSGSVSREKLIAASEREFKAEGLDPVHFKMTNFINTALRDASKSPLTEDETAKYGIAV